ncbi:hypothetical protein CXG81DRAFT_24165 [Caulochytrium protostelioides]|uniref:Uncharacterized protein n=1 Tax=Caulochytrium protostelioides TaxID=1555241 RepID=A0A4P9XCI5_9FUNG|nr:hypothetical protein CXG81DRAFT_24165 [Caulochytrium protostelioides]|eukprot:RKP03164.1 hypothetical protein CXG81DRAFT_24165 [Caulochytrium protostelioides]
MESMVCYGRGYVQPSFGYIDPSWRHEESEDEDDVEAMSATLDASDPHDAGWHDVQLLCGPHQDRWPPACDGSANALRSACVQHAHSTVFEDTLELLHTLHAEARVLRHPRPSTATPRPDGPALRDLYAKLNILIDDTYAYHARRIALTHAVPTGIAGPLAARASAQLHHAPLLLRHATDAPEAAGAAGAAGLPIALLPTPAELRRIPRSQWRTVLALRVQRARLAADERALMVARWQAFWDRVRPPRAHWYADASPAFGHEAWRTRILATHEGHQRLAEIVRHVLLHIAAM